MKKEIHKKLIEIEENIWKEIPFESSTPWGGKYVYSLANPMSLSDIYLEIPLQSELYGTDHKDFKEKLRRITPTFTDDP